MLKKKRFYSYYISGAVSRVDKAASGFMLSKMYGIPKRRSSEDNISGTDAMFMCFCTLYTRCAWYPFQKVRVMVADLTHG